jgi:hypothetical protein
METCDRDLRGVSLPFVVAKLTDDIRGIAFNPNPLFANLHTGQDVHRLPCLGVLSHDTSDEHVAPIGFQVVFLATTNGLRSFNMLRFPRRSTQQEPPPLCPFSSFVMMEPFVPWEPAGAKLEMLLANRV